ncbi:hypothetical protein [Nocardia bovistercoris]|uniref:Uncharacterized protein n=1 Tax=Nocardia bovistercoris TaxID=2785916 RepID=A0A931IAU0_9NOCA|nr:hypothetical protein [Nocardia bovistercoris]MBH0777939.1 hypothetical protein [Nocardia bovistercoris]
MSDREELGIDDECPHETDTFRGESSAHCYRPRRLPMRAPAPIPAEAVRS